MASKSIEEELEWVKEKVLQMMRDCGMLGYDLLDPEVEELIRGDDGCPRKI